MKKTAILILSTLFSVNAFANDSVIYSCKTNENETLRVTKEGNNYVFSYGKTTFKNPIKQVMKNPLTEVAVGSQFTSVSIAMENADKTYVIGHIEPRGNPKGLFEAGFSVQNTKSEETIKSYECKDPVKHNLDYKLMSKSGFAG